MTYPSQQRVRIVLARTIRGLVGLLLVVAAIAKIALPAQASASSLILRQHALGFGVLVITELLVGLWLLSGVWKGPACLVAALLFAGLTAVSAYLWAVGEVSCGCLGRAEVSPKVMVFIDGLALLLLLTIRPKGGELSSMLQPLCRPRRCCLALGSGMAAAVLVLGGVRLEQAGFAFLRGEKIEVHPSVIDFGTGKPSDILDATVEVKNWTDQDFRIVGGTVDCSCIVVEQLPVTVPRGEAVSVAVRLRVPPCNGTGRFVRGVELWTDCPQQRIIRLPVIGQVRAP